MRVGAVALRARAIATRATEQAAVEWHIAMCAATRAATRAAAALQRVAVRDTQATALKRVTVRAATKCAAMRASALQRVAVRAATVRRIAVRAATECAAIRAVGTLRDVVRKPAASRLARKLSVPSMALCGLAAASSSHVQTRGHNAGQTSKMCTSSPGSIARSIGQSHASEMMAIERTAAMQ